jgi:hypothetical protein
MSENLNSRRQFSNVVPDHLDLRDRMYQPPVGVRPPANLDCTIPLPVLDQKDTRACTGFALSTVVNYLLARNGRTADNPVSPFMIYSMARRYDEFPGCVSDTGSSLRGAMKGWYKHGVCRTALWKTIDMPKASKNVISDWWLDAALRPLGAYYRIDIHSVTDMHIALNEAGILYASAICHSGWDQGANLPVSKRKNWTIPMQTPGFSGGGHAFVIVGYNEEGFIIQNSWGTDWGDNGRAILTYEDWIENAMDCWVAQLGVVTQQHKEICASASLRLKKQGVVIAQDQVLRNREIAPFIIDMENNGLLSSTGDFRTNPDDIDSLINLHLSEACNKWGISKNGPVDIAIYAHGGLTGEDAGADTAARWIPALYNAKIFPIYLMWETDLMSTLRNRLQDKISGIDRTTGRFGESLGKWWNERLERSLASFGTVIWGEMKQNADYLSRETQSGCQLLYRTFKKSEFFANIKPRLHLIGHSAGSIVHSYLVDRFVKKGFTFETLNLLAPAVRVDVFEKYVVPLLKNKTVKQLNQFHLTDAVEQKDPTCKNILGYNRSLLYLVSRSFEGGKTTPIMGMETYFSQFNKMLNLSNIKSWSTPCTESTSTTHGGFDKDPATMNSVIKLIKS